MKVIVRPFWPSRCPLTFPLLGIASGIAPLSQAQQFNRKPQTPNILPSRFIAIFTSCRPAYNLTSNPLEFHAFLCNLFTTPDYFPTGFNMQYPFCNWYFYDLSSTSTGLIMVKHLSVTVLPTAWGILLHFLLYPNFVPVFNKFAAPRSTNFPKSVCLWKP